MSYAINVANNNFGSNFRGILFDVSKEWVRSWSHAFLITNLKTFSKKLLAVCPEKGTRRKKRNKTRMAIVNLVALKANAKTYINLFQNHYIPIISKPSRISVTNSKIIHHRNTNNFLKTDVKTEIIKSYISDCFPLSLIFNTAMTDNHRLETFIKRWKRNIQILQEPALVDWDFVTKLQNVNTAYKRFLTYFLDSVI